MNNLHFGVVESTTDPLKLGRCKVRIAGLHNPDNIILPTDDLPWAVPMQPITSAAMSGIGHSPTGVLNGSWVIIVFMDEFNQSPIMIGSLAGIPSKDIGFITEEMRTEENKFADQYDQNDILPTQNSTDPSLIPESEKFLGSMTKGMFNSFAEAIKQRESSGKQYVINQLGYVGWYQLGIAALESIGYVKKGQTSLNNYKNSALNTAEVWTGKDGINNLAAYLSNGKIQDKAMLLYSTYNYKLLKGKGDVSEETPPEKLAGILAVAHNQGHGAATKHLKGEVGKDGNGVSTDHYYHLGYYAVKKAFTLEHATSENINSPSISQTSDDAAEKYSAKAPDPKSQPKGFMDPSGKYPLKDWEKESEVSRLARHTKISKTIVSQKEQSEEKEVAIALSQETWKQPTTPYNAQYPFNHVYTSESGHVMEFDDTPECERIHLYHKSGTFIEMDSGGNQVNKIVGHGCTIYERDGLVLIKGNAHVKCQGAITVVGENIHVEGKGINVAGDNINLGGSNLNLMFENVNVSCSQFSVSASGSIELGSGGNINTSASKFGISASGSVDIKGGGNVNVDGAQIQLNSGAASPSAASPTAASQPQGFSGEFSPIAVKTRSEQAELVNENTDEAAQKASADAANEKTPEPKEVVTSGSKIGYKIVDCPIVKPISIGTKISTNFTIADFCKDGSFPFEGQHGLTGDQIICNLRQLSCNVVELLYARYREHGMKLNSGVRLKGNSISRAKGISQHELGQAVDIGFSKIRGKKNDRELYFNLAKEIITIVPFDQFLFETTSAGSVWIHISFKDNPRYQILTFHDHKKAHEGLVLLK